MADGDWYTVRRRPKSKNKAAIAKQLPIPASNFAFSLLNGISEDSSFLIDSQRKVSKANKKPVGNPLQPYTSYDFRNRHVNKDYDYESVRKAMSSGKPSVHDILSKKEGESKEPPPPSKRPPKDDTLKAFSSSIPTLTGPKLISASENGKESSSSPNVIEQKMDKNNSKRQRCKKEVPSTVGLFLKHIYTWILSFIFGISLSRWIKTIRTSFSAKNSKTDSATKRSSKTKLKKAEPSLSNNNNASCNVKNTSVKVENSTSVKNGLTNETNNSTASFNIVLQGSKLETSSEVINPLASAMKPIGESSKTANEPSFPSSHSPPTSLSSSSLPSSSTSQVLKEEEEEKYSGEENGERGAVEDPAFLPSVFLPWIHSIFLTAHPDLGGAWIRSEGAKNGIEVKDVEEGRNEFSILHPNHANTSNLNPSNPKAPTKAIIPWDTEAHASSPVTAVALIVPKPSSSSSPSDPSSDVSPLVLSVGHDSRVRIWSWEEEEEEEEEGEESEVSFISSSLQPLRELQGHNGRVEALCVESFQAAIRRGARQWDERLFVTTGRDSTVKVWALSALGEGGGEGGRKGGDWENEGGGKKGKSEESKEKGENSNENMKENSSEGKGKMEKKIRVKRSGIQVKEVASIYVFESVRSMAVRWAGERKAGDRAYGIVALGCRSGAILVYDLASGRKLQTLRGHTEEVTCLSWLGNESYGSCRTELDGILVSGGGKDATVRIWDLRTTIRILDGDEGKGTLNQAVQSGKAGVVVDAISSVIHSPVCSVAVDESSLTLYVGDHSSSVKAISYLPLVSPIIASALSSSSSLPPPSSPQEATWHVPNALSFSGDNCPIAGLWVGLKEGNNDDDGSDVNRNDGAKGSGYNKAKNPSKAVSVSDARNNKSDNTSDSSHPSDPSNNTSTSVLVSGSIAWVTSDSSVLEEAAEDESVPVAFLNLHSVSNNAKGSPPSNQCDYLSSLRLAPGIVTCMAGDFNSGRLVVGGSTGWIVGLRTLTKDDTYDAQTMLDLSEKGYGVHLTHGMDIGVEEVLD